jgi:hypothetical protein
VDYVPASPCNAHHANTDNLTVKWILAVAIAALFISVGVPATAQTSDHPSSNISTARAGIVLTVGTTYTFHGNSVNGEQGGITETEVSLDGGLTWQVAAGATEIFDVVYTPTTPGAVTLMSRASTAAVTEQPTHAVTLTIVGGTVTCPCTFWLPDVPNLETVAENDPQPIEVGLRFRPDRDGVVTGLFFYRYPSNTGPFLGHLWSADGQLLAEASLDGSGDYIPRITFDQPVAVHAGQTYVVSYFTQSGNYAQTVDYFTDAVVQSPFAADADAGVYAYGGGFPTSTWMSANYWVGPVFSA